MQREHAQRRTWSAREPAEREVAYYWYLTGHEKLPEMGGGSLVGFMHDANSAMWPSTNARAATDMTMGSKALGCFRGETLITTSAAGAGNHKYFIL